MNVCMILYQNRKGLNMNALTTYFSWTYTNMSATASTLELVCGCEKFVHFVTKPVMGQRAHVHTNFVLSHALPRSRSPK